MYVAGGHGAVDDVDGSVTDDSTAACDDSAIASEEASMVTCPTDGVTAADEDAIEIFLCMSHWISISANCGSSITFFSKPNRGRWQQQLTFPCQVGQQLQQWDPAQCQV